MATRRDVDDPIVDGGEEPDSFVIEFESGSDQASRKHPVDVHSRYSRLAYLATISLPLD